MFNKEEVLQLIEENGQIYCTTETGRGVDKNALEGLVDFYDLNNPIAKFVGMYEGEDFEDGNGNEVFDGDAIYILVEK